MNAVLPLYVQVEREDSRSTVVNSCGVSTADLALVLPQLKLHTLRLLSALLRVPHLGLSKVGSALIRPLSSVLATPTSSQREIAAALHCFSQAGACFPTLLPKVI